MSEFECRNGHLMGSGQFTCKECGAPLWRMDSKSNRELEGEDEYWPDEGDN